MIRKTVHATREMISGLLSNGTVTQNLAITMSGNFLAQGIGFLLTPVIARIYGPAAYGLFSLFMATANALAPFATLQLPAGFALISEEEPFKKLLRATVLWLFLFVVLVLLLVAVFGHRMSEALQSPALAPLLFLLPLHLLVTGFDEILLGWSIRRAEFQRSAVGRVFAVVTGKLTTVIIGWLAGPRALGIIVGNMIQYPLDSFAKLGRNKLSFLLPFPSFAEMGKELSSYASYPLFVATGVALSNLGNQAPIYLLAAMQGDRPAGLFAMAASLVLMPLNLIINSSAAVFLQKSAEVVQANPSGLGPLARKLHDRLFALGAVGLLSFALISEPLISLLLGEPWREAGRFAGLLAAGSLLVSPSFTLSVIYRQKSKEYLNFWLQVGFLLLKLLTLLVALRFGNMHHTVFAYATVISLTAFINLIILFRMLGIPNGRLLVQGLVSGIALALIFMLKAA
jgi:O-antigen/teichoic acid export membrane protein